jgi:hypothetical protein
MKKSKLPQECSTTPSMDSDVEKMQASHAAEKMGAKRRTRVFCTEHAWRGATCESAFAIRTVKLSI